MNVMGYIGMTILAAGGFVLGFLVRWLLSAASASSLKLQIAKLEMRLQQCDGDRDELLQKTRELERVNTLCADLKARMMNESERKAALEEQKKVMEAEFRRLASSVLESNSRALSDSNKHELDKVVAPLKEKLSEFGNLVSKTYSDTTKEQSSLKEQIAALLASSKQVSDGAKKLADALSGGPKVQGEWGEQMLEVMLENCGLTRGREYDTQETLRGEDGHVVLSGNEKRMRPDVVVHYPDKTDIIIDAKTSLTAYMQYLDAATENERQAAANAHLASVRRHVSELSSKSYQEYAKSIDFVMMFIPNDSAYMLAMQSDPHLWMESYGKRVMIVSPSQLVPILKMVSVLWRRDEQNANTMRIVKLSGDIYAKLSAFCESMDKVGKGLDSARANYDEAVKRLSTGRDNAIRKLEQLRAMGADTKGRRIPAKFAEGNEPDLPSIQDE